MKLNLNAFSYRIFIDPLLSGLRKTVTSKIIANAKVIDIACGTGTLAIETAVTARHVTAVDLDERLISFASARATKKDAANLSFELRDAADLSSYPDKEFDIALISMAIHQFQEETALKILREMKRIADKAIIADYNYPMPRGIYKSIAYGIERIAGGDHFRNFRNYNSRGGIKWFTTASGLTIRSFTVNENGVFAVIVCD